MVKLLPLLSLLLTCTLAPAAACALELPENPNNVPDYVHEAQTCERVDLRPLLVHAGFPEIRNRGGRLTNESFVLSEMLGLALKRTVSARWLEHWLADHLDAGELADGRKPLAATSPKLLRQLRVTVSAIGSGRLHTCSEESVPSEDLESTRLLRLDLLASRGSAFPASAELFDLFGSMPFRRATFTPYTCKGVSSQPAKLKFNSRANIDSSLRARSLPLVRVTDGVFAIAGRRLNPNSGCCEYLVRDYVGPTCEGPSCEDGSHWVERESVKPLSVWSIE